MGLFLLSRLMTGNILATFLILRGLLFNGDSLPLPRRLSDPPPVLSPLWSFPEWELYVTDSAPQRRGILPDQRFLRRQQLRCHLPHLPALFWSEMAVPGGHEQSSDRSGMD
jgi:hypothetical protein